MARATYLSWLSRTPQDPPLPRVNESRFARGLREGGLTRSLHRTVFAALLTAVGCARGSDGAGELHAQKAALEREVHGLREIVARAERHEPLLPPEDLVVAIDESLLRGVINAQLPFEGDAAGYHLKLTEAEVLFRGAPGVRLHGGLKRPGVVTLEAVVEVLGALEDISVDEAQGALKARIAVDHIAIEKAAGVESFLSGSALDEVARAIRLEVADQLPAIEIPVSVQQSIELPAVTTGPVRLAGAKMPIAANVSRVIAGQGQLWVAIHLQPGEIVKTGDAPEAADSTAAHVEEARERKKGTESP